MLVLSLVSKQVTLEAATESSGVTQLYFNTWEMYTSQKGC